MKLLEIFIYIKSEAISKHFQCIGWIDLQWIIIIIIIKIIYKLKADHPQVVLKKSSNNCFFSLIVCVLKFTKNKNRRIKKNSDLKFMWYIKNYWITTDFED